MTAVYQAAAALQGSPVLPLNEKVQGRLHLWLPAAGAEVLVPEETGTNRTEMCFKACPYCAVCCWLTGGAAEQKVHVGIWH